MSGLVLRNRFSVLGESTSDDSASEAEMTEQALDEGMKETDDTRNEEAASDSTSTAASSSRTLMRADAPEFIPNWQAAVEPWWSAPQIFYVQMPLVVYQALVTNQAYLYLQI